MSHTARAGRRRGWKFLLTKFLFLGSKNARTNLGGGGGRNISKFCSLQIFFPENVPGVLKRTQIFLFLGGGILGCLGRPTPAPGGRAGSENDTLLPMTMTRDRPKFWNGPSALAVKSYHPETLAAEE